MKALLFGILVLCIASCATIKQEPRIDGTTAATTEASLNQITRRLSKKEQVAFALSLVKIQFSEIKSVHDLVGNSPMHKTNYEVIGKKIHGMTYKEIIAYSNQSPIKIDTQEQ